MKGQHYSSTFLQLVFCSLANSSTFVGKKRSMTLHLFNPEHDIALASNLKNFTAPHAGRQLRHDLGWLPALWANEEDIVFVEDEASARRDLNRISTKLPIKPKALLSSSINHNITNISVWGWNAALKSYLQKKGINSNLMPSNETLKEIRDLSHRRTSSRILSIITKIKDTIGTSEECSSEEEVNELVARWNKIVIKAPWSSSGRGVRFVDTIMSDTLKGWLRNIIKDQGSVIVEPYYNKVKDFGMEFEALPNNSINYLGLSLFHTMNGAYTGNILATERWKLQAISQYIPTYLLQQVKQSLCEQLSIAFKNRYAGPFGIDMMIVANAENSCFQLHPCVEINLRRTMGHVALALTERFNPQNDDELQRVMRIAYESNQYKLKLQHL